MIELMISEEERKELERIPLLTKDNYGVWKKNMKEFLLSKQLLGIEDETVPPPLPNKQSTVLYCIRRRCGTRALIFLTGIRSVERAWNQLAVMYESEQMSSTNYTWCLPLYRAIVDGDWKKAKPILERNNRAILTASLTSEAQIPLHIAVQKGQVQVVEELVKIMPRESLTIRDKYGRTALHIAASGENKNIVKVLVEKCSNPLLMVLEDNSDDDNIPLSIAVRASRKDMVYFLYWETMTMFDHDKEVAGPGTDENQSGKIRAGLLTSLIYGDFYDFALDLLDRFPSLVKTKDIRGKMALDALSQKPSAFRSSFPTLNSGGFGIVEYYMQKIIYSYINVNEKPQSIKEDVENSISGSRRTEGSQHISNAVNSTNRLFSAARKVVPGFETIYRKKVIHITAQKLLQKLWKMVAEEADELVYNDYGLVAAMFGAIQSGIVEFIDEVMMSNPQFICRFESKTDRSIFHSAIIYRQKHIFRKIHDVGPMRFHLTKFADNSGNYMLHLAAFKSPPQKLNLIPGPVLQMQHEVLWYKEVLNIMPPDHKDIRNEEGKTPPILFTEQHAELLKEARSWMTGTAIQCMAVAGVIVAIMFAAAFTVPGGKGSDNENPSSVSSKRSMVFIASVALTLYSSVTSIFIFLAILITSRYAEEDFLESLPKMFSIAFLFLFISVVGMMITFVVAISVFIHHIWWVSFPVALLASIPVIIYFPLFVEMIYATHGRNKTT